MKGIILIASIVSTCVLFLFYGIAVYFGFSDVVELSKKDLGQNIDFTKDMFRECDIQKILLDADYNVVTIIFQLRDYDKIISYLNKNGTKKQVYADHVEYQCQDIIFHVYETKLYLEKVRDM